MINPKNFKYSINHEWVRLDNDSKKEKIGYLGISYFAQKELGDIIYLDIDNSILSKKINKNEIFGTIEAVKTVSDLFMPISGIVLEINNKLLKNPELINQSYQEWILKITILNLEEYNELMNLNEYQKYSKK